MEDILGYTFRICFSFLSSLYHFYSLRDAWLFQDWLRIFKVLFIATGLVSYVVQFWTEREIPLIDIKFKRNQLPFLAYAFNTLQLHLIVLFLPMSSSKPCESLFFSATCWENCSCCHIFSLLSYFSRFWLCATPSTRGSPGAAAHLAPPSLGFSRQEHWSGLPFPSPMHENEKWKWSRSVVSDS